MGKVNERRKHGILDWIEKVGNKILHPFMLFFFLSVFIILLSWGLNYLDVGVIDSVKNEVVKVKNLLSSEGVNIMLQNTIKNFTGFLPLGLVLVMTLGIGLAEHVGLVSAFIFCSLGKHPLAGIAVGYAATTAGFSANLIVAGTDALLAGISTEAMKIVNPNITVSVVDNWYFMGVSTFLLAIVGTVVTEKIIEPRLGKYTGKKIIEREAVN